MPKMNSKESRMDFSVCTCHHTVEETLIHKPLKNKIDLFKYIYILFICVGIIYTLRYKTISYFCCP